jgi:hypothetical protein
MNTNHYNGHVNSFLNPTRQKGKLTDNPHHDGTGHLQPRRRHRRALPCLR